MTERHDYLGLYDMTPAALEVERRRLTDGLKEGEIIQGSTVDSYYVVCGGDAPAKWRSKSDLTVDDQQQMLADWEWPKPAHSMEGRNNGLRSIHVVRLPRSTLPT